MIHHESGYTSFCALLIAISSAFGGRNDITSGLKFKSWITKENLTTIMKLSFPYSRCCNVYLDDSDYEIGVLFDQFRSVYPYGYLLKSRIYECQGYFLLAMTEAKVAQAMNKVPSSLSTTEILILINSNLNTASSVFNVSLYDNANANIVSPSGIWTLSENYLSPRVFRKVDRYEEMARQSDIVDLKGREIHVGTFYRPPVSYLNKTTNRTINGVQEEVFVADTELERDGIEMKVFMLIAQKLNFTWTIKKIRGNDKYGSRVNETTWKGGIIQLLHEKQIDIAFASIWLTADHYAFINLTEPWYQLFIHFLVPRPRPVTSFWALTRPFSVNAWILLIATLLIHSLYMYTRAWIDPRFPKRFRNFMVTLTELTGRLLGIWVPRNVSNVKLQLYLWQTAGVVIVTAYCSSLAASLASSEYEERIDTIRQFVEANLTWGRTGQPPPFHEYLDIDDPYAMKLPDRYVPIKNDEDLHANIQKGNFAIIGRFVGSVFFPEDYIQNDDLQNYRVMREMIGKFHASFAVQPWLLRPVNTMMLWLKESGITFFHLKDVIRRRASFNLRDVLTEHDGNDGRARVLGLTPLAAGFSMLLVGLLLSGLVFYLELKRASGSRTIPDVLREIERKRKKWELSRARERRKQCGRFYCHREVSTRWSSEFHVN